jgi:hypothetical protein
MDFIINARRPMVKSFQTYIIIAVLSIGSVYADEQWEEFEQSSLSNEEIAGRSKAEKVTSLPPGCKKPECPTPVKCCPKPQECPPACCEPMVLLPSQSCPNAWRISGDFLYFLPTFDDTYFVLDSGISTTFPHGKRLNNDFNFKPGFRVGAEYTCCDSHRGLQGSYSYVSASQRRTVSGEHLWATLSRPDVASSFENYLGTASADLSLLYQNAELNYSQQILNSCGLYFYIQPGIEYAYLRLSEINEYVLTATDITGEIDQKSRGWGVGPQIGLGMDYNFYQGSLTCSSTHAITGTSLFSGSILMGRGKTKNQQYLADETLLKVSDEHTWKTIPAFHARLGLNYMIQASCFGVSLGVGYEFNTYVRALARTIFADDVADASCSTNYYNFDLQGLFVSGAVSF